MDVITNLTPRETQLVSGLGTSDANAVYHQWLTDTLKSVAVNAAVEGASATSKTTTNPTRLLNITQIIENTYQVSGTERAANTAGFEDRMAYERTKALKEKPYNPLLVKSSVINGRSRPVNRIAVILKNYNHE